MKRRLAALAVATVALLGVGACASTAGVDRQDQTEVETNEETQSDIEEVTDDEDNG